MTETDKLRSVVTAGLLQAGRQWRKTAEEALEAHGISEAMALPLVWIGRLGGGVRQVTLASHVGIEGPSLVRLLDQLTKMGLVVRKDDPTDRRAKGVCLTREGKALAKKIEALLVGVRTQVLAGVNEADLEAAVRVLKIFEEAGAARKRGEGTS